MRSETKWWAFQSFYQHRRNAVSVSSREVIFVSACHKSGSGFNQRRHQNGETKTDDQTSLKTDSNKYAESQPLPSRSSINVDEQVDWKQQAMYKQRHKFRLYQQARKTGNARLDALGTKLCAVLRHQATGLKLDVKSNGFVKVADILSLKVKTPAKIPLNQHSIDELLEVVKRDPKHRYSTMTQDGDLYVRANQGHSMKAVVSQHLLTEITAAEQVPVCVHGTFKCFLPSILKTGLNRMGRNHVHFAVGLLNEEGVISGMMDTVEVLIYLNVAKALKDGMKLYVSENKVLLTEGFGGTVPCKYFEKLVEWPSFGAIDW